jgi:hypothetical protein
MTINKITTAVHVLHPETLQPTQVVPDKMDPAEHVVQIDELVQTSQEPGQLLQIGEFVGFK